MAVLGEQIREGHVLGIAEGPVLVDPSADPKKDPALATRGRILGGGVAIKSRPLGLVISHQHQSVRIEPGYRRMRSIIASTRSSTAASKAWRRRRPTSSSIS